MSDAPPRIEPRWILLFALLASFAVYAPTLSRGLVDYDDGYMIRDNWVVRDPSMASVRTILFDLDSPKRVVLSPEYLPVRDLSIMADVAIWGDWYPGFHLTNVALYLAAIVVWFAVLVGFGIDRTIAAIALTLWALHPAHAESVAWLAERKGLLGVLFAGLAGLGYVRFRAGRSWRWLALAVVATVFAVWSKAQAAFGVAALGGLELALPAPERRQRAWLGLGAMAFVGALAFVPVMVLAARADVVGLSTSTAPAGRVAMVLGVHGLYLELAAMVVPNAVSYPLGTDGPSLVQIVLGAGFLAAWLVALRTPSLRAPAALWLIAWFPVSHLLLPLQMIYVADRYLLIPTLGYCLALSVLIGRIARPQLRWLLLGVLVLASILRTIDAQTTWHNATSLWERATTSNPHDGEAWAAYAEALARAGDDRAARAAVDDGLTYVQHPRLLLRRALLLVRQDPAAGLVAMRAAAVAGDPRAMSNLALLLLERDQLDEALRWARDGAARGPMYAPARRALGRVELAANHPREAETAFRRAYELEPTCVNRYNLALALAKLGRGGDARTVAERCADDRGLGTRVRSLLHELAP